MAITIALMLEAFSLIADKRLEISPVAFASASMVKPMSCKSVRPSLAKREDSWVLAETFSMVRNNSELVAEI